MTELNQYQEAEPTETILIPPLKRPFTERTQIFPESIADFLTLNVKPLTPPKPPAPGITATLVQEVKDKEYRNFTIDLTTAHTNERIKLQDLGIIGDSMTIIQADDTFTYKLNNASNDPTPGIFGAKETEFEIREVYYTNPASAILGAQAIVRVVWNPRLIRLP